MLKGRSVYSGIQLRHEQAFNPRWSAGVHRCVELQITLRQIWMMGHAVRNASFFYEKLLIWRIYERLLCLMCKLSFWFALIMVSVKSKNSEGAFLLFHDKQSTRADPIKGRHAALLQPIYNSAMKCVIILFLVSKALPTPISTFLWRDNWAFLKVAGPLHRGNAQIPDVCKSVVIPRSRSRC